MKQSMSSVCVVPYGMEADVFRLLAECSDRGRKSEDSDTLGLVDILLKPVL